MKKKHQDSPSKGSNKNNKNAIPPKKFKFYLGSRERYITISSDFQSGNIDFVRQFSQFQYRLCSVHDGTFTDHRVNSKSWFYFSVTGFPANTKGRFIIAKVQTLQGMYYSKYVKAYRPVYKIGQQGEWKRIPTQAQLVMRQNGQLECIFDYQFRKQTEKVFFAFCYPYTYSDYLKYMNSLNEFIYNDDFYFHKQVFIKSPQNRDIHLITITSYDHQDKSCQNQQIFCEDLFPEKCRPIKFKKPVIFVSARVHPGETPASYAMKGVIDFLTNKEDLRVILLRKMFVFMIVPMINVDGVYNGHFRMDNYGKNLNRFYIQPDRIKQPAVFAIKQLVKHLNSQNRLSFYFDLHAHNAKKGCFIYGNAISDFVEQVQSQVFCKMISMNNRGFQYEYCNFTQKHMKAKDRGQDLTKQGCGRVVMYRLAKIIHSYSVQCGIVSPNKMNTIPDTPNIQFKVDGKGFQADRCENNSDPIYKTNNSQNALFTPEMYENLGKNLMVSILDVFDKNPYNRVYNSKYKNMDMLRRLTAFEIFHEAQRFRMFERFIFGKVKNINQLIRQVLNTKLHYKKLYNFYFFDDKQLKNIIWPQNIPGLAKPKIPDSPTKLKRFKSSQIVNTVSSNDYSESFMKVLMLLSQNQVKQQQNSQIEEDENNKKTEQNNDQQDNKSSETEDFEPDQQKIEYIRSLQRMMQDPETNQSQKLAITEKLAQAYKNQQQNIVNQELDELNLVKKLTDIKQEQINLNSQQQLTEQHQIKLFNNLSQIKKQEAYYAQNDNLLRISTKMIQDIHKNCINSPERKNKQSPSVRVRRLLKQQFITEAQIKLVNDKNSPTQFQRDQQDSITQTNTPQRTKKNVKKNYRSSTTSKALNSLNNDSCRNFHESQMENKNISSTGLDLRKNIYQSIKNQIKQELKRDQYKQYNKIYTISRNPNSQRQDNRNRKNIEGSATASLSINSSQVYTVHSNSPVAPKLCSPVKIQKQRIKSWSNRVNKNGFESIHAINGANSRHKLQLPSLNNQMYILSTSSKAFLKKS